MDGEGHITTVEEHNDLMNDPAAFRAYLGTVIGEMLTESIETTLADALKSGGVQRLPEDAGESADPNTPDPTGGFKAMSDWVRTVGQATRAGHDPRLTRVLGEGQGDAGGFLVPEEYRAELLRRTLEAAVIRPRARVVPMSSSTLRYPAIRDTTHSTNVYGGIQAYWSPESSTATASEPTFSSVLLEAMKLVGYTSITEELLADETAALQAFITEVFPEALAYFEDVAFIEGTGAGQPTGLLNAPATITVAKEGGQVATSIVTENLEKMFARMLPGSVDNSVWIANQSTIPQLFSLTKDVGTGGVPVFMQTIQNSPVFQIYGRPVVFTEKCKSLGTTGDIYFTDLSYYLIGDRQSIAMAMSEHVRFAQGEVVFRFIERLAGRCWLDSALTPRDGGDTLSPIVKLAAR